MDTQTKNELHQILVLLDRKDDEVWTSDGLPRLDFINDQLTESITRAELSSAFPKFHRNNIILDVSNDSNDLKDGENTDSINLPTNHSITDSNDTIDDVDEDDEIKLLNEKINKAQANLDEIIIQQKAINEKFIAVQSELCVYRNKLSKYTAMNPAEMVQAYQKTQAETRAKMTNSVSGKTVY